MPRQFFKRHMPDPDALKKHPHLRRLGSHLHNPNLWHLNRRSVSWAFLIGVFCAFMPMPFQMLLAAGLAIWLQSNLPISVGLVWISNPFTIPPIFYFTYKVGAIMLGIPDQEFGFELSMELITERLSLVWQPLLLGSLTCGVFFSILSFVIVRALWARHVIKNWKARHAARQACKKAKQLTRQDAALKKHKVEGTKENPGRD